MSVRVVPKTSIVDPTRISAAFLALDAKIDRQASAFAQTAWIFPRSFEKPPRDAVPEAKVEREQQQKPQTAEARPPAAPHRKSVVAARTHVVKAKLDTAKAKREWKAPSPWVPALPQELAPTSQP